MFSMFDHVSPCVHNSSRYSKNTPIPSHYTSWLISFANMRYCDTPITRWYIILNNAHQQ